MKLKVLHVLEATEGGTRRHVVDLLAGSDRRLFDAGLVYSRDRADGSLDEDLAHLRSLGTRLIEVPMVRRISPRRDAAALIELVRVLRRERPQILHLHAAKAGMLGRIASRALRPRPAVVYTPHGGAFHDVFGSIRNRAFALLERTVVPLTDMVINVSEYSTHVYAAKTGVRPHRLRTIHNGVSLPGQPDPAAVAHFRSQLELPNDCFAIAVVAQLNPNKGHAVLLEALSLLKRDASRLSVAAVLIGDGPLRRELEERRNALHLGREVRFLGFRPNPLDYVAACDALVLPSIAEAFGLVLVEAMLVGRPVIASRVGGIPEIVEHEECGLLAPPGDPLALARAIERLASDPELRARLCERSRARAEQFVLPRMVRETEAVYRALIPDAKLRERGMESTARQGRS